MSESFWQTENEAITDTINAEADSCLLFLPLEKALNNKSFVTMGVFDASKHLRAIDKLINIYVAIFREKNTNNEYLKHYVVTEHETEEGFWD